MNTFRCNVMFFFFRQSFVNVLCDDRVYGTVVGLCFCIDAKSVMSIFHPVILKQKAGSVTVCMFVLLICIKHTL